MSVGKRLRLLREEKNLTLGELSKQINIAKSTLSRYENDKVLPGIDVLKIFASYYNVSTDYIIGTEDKTELYQLFKILKDRGIVESLDEELSAEKMEKIADLLENMLKL